MKWSILRCWGILIASASELKKPPVEDMEPLRTELPYPYTSAGELLDICSAQGLSIESVVRVNENAIGVDDALDEKLDHVADAMMACAERGLNAEGLLPGGLKVQRRAPALWNRLQSCNVSNQKECLFDWLDVYAMVVNEENAAGGQVVTAPTI